VVHEQGRHQEYRDASGHEQEQKAGHDQRGAPRPHGFGDFHVPERRSWVYPERFRSGWRGCVGNTPASIRAGMKA
jgi:hypothetical protein